MNHESKKGGFTLTEVLVGSALFLVVALAVYGAFVSLFKLANLNQANILGVGLADEQFEIIRNMPYVNVGLTNGIPQGVLAQTQTLTRGGFTFTVTLTIRNINLSTTTVQASSKLVEVGVTCPLCQKFTPVDLTGVVSPANLQSAGFGGALVIQVFDGNGQPVPGASVHIQSVATSTITDDDVTDNNGVLNVIGVVPGANAYQITVTKAGYSTDRTYAPGSPSPIKPNATVLNQQVTQASFFIDKLSSLNFSSVTSACVPTGNYHFSLTGAKEIKQGVPKYSQNLSTNGSGSLNLNSMEWDSYILAPNDPTYDLAGFNPLNPLALSPGNSQNVQFVVIPKNSNSLLVTVADSATKLPVSNALVELSAGGYDQSVMTGQGYIDQTDWSAGSGQSAFVSPSKYWADDGNVDTSTSTGSVVLKNVFGSYNPNGRLESSTFDMGTSSNFYSLLWKPANQPPLAGSNSVRFQFATNPSSTPPTWNYLGPDGTAGTYYSVPGSPIAAANNGKQFARYMAYLSTNTATVTPSVSDVSFTYTSACIPPGQVIFQGLSAGTYTLNVSKSGYTLYSNPVSVGSGWQEQQVLLGP